MQEDSSECVIQPDVTHSTSAAIRDSLDRHMIEILSQQENVSCQKLDSLLTRYKIVHGKVKEKLQLFKSEEFARYRQNIGKLEQYQEKLEKLQKVRHRVDLILKRKESGQN